MQKNSRALSLGQLKSTENKTLVEALSSIQSQLLEIKMENAALKHLLTKDSARGSPMKEPLFSFVRPTPSVLQQMSFERPRLVPLVERTVNASSHPQAVTGTSTSGSTPIRQEPTCLDGISTSTVCAAVQQLLYSGISLTQSLNLVVTNKAERFCLRYFIDKLLGDDNNKSLYLNVPMKPFVHDPAYAEWLNNVKIVSTRINDSVLQRVATVKRLQNETAAETAVTHTSSTKTKRKNPKETVKNTLMSIVTLMRRNDKEDKRESDTNQKMLTFTSGGK